MLYLTLGKGFRLVLWIIESDNFSHIQVFENVNIAACRVSVASLLTGNFVNWAHKGQKLTWNDPVEVPVFDFFIMFVFFYIESVVIIPPLAHSNLKPFYAMLNSALVETFAFTGVSVSSKKSVIRLKRAPRLLSTLFQDYHHEGGNEESTIS